MTEEIRFSTHALLQFSKRICLPILESTTRIREVWEHSAEISREEAFELTQDRAILKKENNHTRFYLVDLGREEILPLIKLKGNHLPLETMTGVFVVKEHNCVTFKTSLESMIWQNISKVKYGAIIDELN